MENVLIVNIKVNVMPKHHPCTKTTDKKGGGGVSSHKSDFDFKVLISEIEENHAHACLEHACKVYVGPTPVIFANLK